MNAVERAFFPVVGWRPRLGFLLSCGVLSFVGVKACGFLHLHPMVAIPLIPTVIAAISVAWYRAYPRIDPIGPSYFWGVAMPWAPALLHPEIRGMYLYLVISLGIIFVLVKRDEPEYGPSPEPHRNSPWVFRDGQWVWPMAGLEFAEVRTRRAAGVSDGEIEREANLMPGALEASIRALAIEMGTDVSALKRWPIRALQPIWPRVLRGVVLSVITILVVGSVIHFLRL